MTIAKTAGRRSFAGYVAKYHEIWFWYPKDEPPASQVTRDGAVLSLTDGSWFKVSILAERTAFYQGHDNVLAANGSSRVLNHETGAVGRSGNDGLGWSIGSAPFYLNSARQRAMVRGMWPDFKDQSGDVTMTVTARDKPQSLASAAATATLSWFTEKADFRVSGRLIEITFSGNDNGGSDATFMRLGTPVFDVIGLGER